MGGRTWEPESAGYGLRARGRQENFLTDPSGQHDSQDRADPGRRTEAGMRTFFPCELGVRM